VATRIDATLGDLLAAWVEGVRRRAVWVIGSALLVTAGSLVYAAGHLGVNADTDELFDESLRFRQLREELDRAFPQLNDVALVVIDATTRVEAEDAARVLIERLDGEGETFASVYAPGVDPFFDRNGLRRRPSPSSRSSPGTRAFAASSRCWPPSSIGLPAPARAAWSSPRCSMEWGARCATPRAFAPSPRCSAS
jgi:hypothetical protein